MNTSRSNSPTLAPASTPMAWPRLWGSAALLTGLGLFVTRLAGMAQGVTAENVWQFGAAFAFVTGGSALVLATFARDTGSRHHARSAALLLAALVWGLGAVRLLRQFAHPGDAVDQWIAHYLAIAAVTRTPLSAVASIGMLLWASGFMLTIGQRQARPESRLQHIASLMIVAHGTMVAVAIVGIVLRIWGFGTSKLYLPAAEVIGFAHAMLSLGLLSLSRATLPRQKSRAAPFTWSSTAVALQLSLTVFGWVALSHSEQQHLAQKIEAQARGLQRAFTDAMSSRSVALERMARRWEVSGGTPPDLWRDDAEAYVETLPGLQAIAYADSTARVVRIAPLAGNAEALGFDLRSEALRRRSLDRSRDIKAAVFTAQVTLAQGGQGFLLARPLTVGGRFEGWLCAVFRTEDLFSVLGRPVDDNSFSLEVISAGRSVYRNNVTAAYVSDNLTHSFAMPNGDGDWLIRLKPSQATMENLQSDTPSLLLASGMAVALLLALAFRLFERGADQKDQLLAAKHSLTALSEETRKLALVSTHTHNAVAITDATGRCQWVNEAFCAITGYSAAKLLGGDLRELFDTPQSDSAVVAQIAAAFKSGTRLNVELPRHRSNAPTLWASVEVAPVHDSTGQLSNFIVVGTDITFTKQVQFELDANRRFLKNLIDLMPGMVGYWDTSLRCRFANSAYLEWFGRTQAQMQGITMQDLMGQELFSKNEPYIRAVLRGERQDFERQITKPDGSVGFTWAHYMPDEHMGEVRGFFVLVSDITEIKQSQLRLEELNLTLNERTREAETASRAKSAFLSSMSHELRTPMNAMLGFAQLIHMDTELSADHKDNVSEVLRAGKHLLSLINDLLSLAKIEAGHTELKLSTIDAVELVEECLALVRPMTSLNGIRLEMAAMPSASFTSDRRLLKQVLINLLSNAIKYNRPQGFVQMSVALNDARQICLTVKDSGIGIALHRQSELFQSFNRLGAEESDIDGHGIGLAVSHRLVSALGGSIAVTSEEGVGSSFTVTLPISLETVVSNSPSEGKSAGEHELGNLHATILNIDDSPGNRRLVKGILAKYPHLQMLEAGTGETGIEMAHAHRPDLILMDIMLPGIDGVEALHRLRELPETRDIPIVAISASVTQDHASRISSAGFNGQLDKPFVVDDFLALIHGLLKARTLQRPPNRGPSVN